MMAIEMKLKNSQQAVNKLRSFLSDEEFENINKILHKIIQDSNAIQESNNSNDILKRIKNLSGASSQLMRALNAEAIQEQDNGFKVSDCYKFTTF